MILTGQAGDIPRGFQQNLLHQCLILPVLLQFLVKLVHGQHFLQCQPGKTEKTVLVGSPQLPPQHVALRVQNQHIRVRRDAVSLHFRQVRLVLGINLIIDKMFVEILPDLVVREYIFGHQLTRSAPRGVEIDKHLLVLCFRLLQGILEGTLEKTDTFPSCPGSENTYH